MAGANAKDRWKAMLHVQAVFKHHGDAKDYAQSKPALPDSVRRTNQLTMDIGLTPAEESEQFY